MDQQVQELAQYLVDRLQQAPPNTRIIVGIAGIPASGKSTLAAQIVARTNTSLETTSPVTGGPKAVLVGLDGWHLTRAQLDAFADPVEAHARRGAHWTFDGQAYVSFVTALRSPISDCTVTSSEEATQVIKAPSFDHAVKDPVADDIIIRHSDRIVVIEGLYTFLSFDPWCVAGKLLDERWVIDIDPAEATKRLVARHIQSGITCNLEEATRRAEENDMPNGRFLLENLIQPTQWIQSVSNSA
ncbi:P-loop containing nucleoside triphosphate hydrolase protein [Rickenella mellea]|uniref:P-loop containing nucleoside triphosphate hydrolase protein n=1 Tax=Rickenella mellea TaxID=50990 RepID=A0A4Y7Q4X2_9AGAM|nr:P-loop containing nucleoside triphosphate hydrolase protein [Rickenella mellea]